MWGNNSVIGCVSVCTYLDKEESYSIGSQGSAELEVPKLGIDLTEVVELAVVTKDIFLHLLNPYILFGQELSEVQEPEFVPSLSVVAVLDLTLVGSKLCGFFKSARVSAVNDGITRLWTIRENYSNTPDPTYTHMYKQVFLLNPH